MGGAHDGGRGLLRRSRASPTGRSSSSRSKRPVAIPVALATGRPVIGIDSSPAMLEQARVRADEAGVELQLREGDMRELTLDEPAGLVYCPFRALLHLPTWADRRRTFERVAASLRPGGRFAWNAFAFDHRIAAQLDGQHRDEPLPHGTPSGTTASTSCSTTARPARCGGRPGTNGWGSSTSPVWSSSLFGGFGGEPFDDDSREYVFVARR